MESTEKTKLSEADFELAQQAGLTLATPGTNKQDVAIAGFAASIRAPLLAQVTAYAEMMTKATLTIAALHDAPPIGKKLTLTGLQISCLHDALGGELETDLSISRFEASTDLETGDALPEGLYCWYDEYPEEGRIYLPEDADAAQAVIQVAPAATPSLLVIERLPADDTEGGAL